MGFSGRGQGRSLEMIRTQGVDTSRLAKWRRGAPVWQIVGVSVALVSGLLWTSTGTAHASAASPDVAWVCAPGMANDPCETPLDTTVIAPDGTQTVTNTTSPPEDQKPVDCFYVYPSVSSETTVATQAADPAVSLVTQWQTSNFSPYCRVFAPAYRQYSSTNPPPVGYLDVLAAWNQYLAQDNDGRGVILIGHSQGAILLRQLIKTQIDPNTAERRLLVGAILLGGNVLTLPGQTTGGDFQNVPLCTTKGQFGCVVAYSTYESDPIPGFSPFGNSGFDELSYLYSQPSEYGTPPDLPTGLDYQVACTDPGVLSGQTGSFGVTAPEAVIPTNLPVFTSNPETNTDNGDVNSLGDNEQTTLTTPSLTKIPVPQTGTTWFSEYQFSGSCQTINGAHVYRYYPQGDSPTFGQPDGIGTHEIDMQLGVNRLTSIARLQTQSWLAANSEP